MRTPLAAALLALAAPAAAADFEGVIDTRMTMAGKEAKGEGTGRLWVSGQGSRMEMRMSTPQGQVKMTVLHLKASPDVVYFVNDDKKTYTELDRNAEAPERDRGPAKKLTVKRLGNEKVAGYDCSHAIVTDEQGVGTEVWVTRAIGGAEAFWAAQAGERTRKSGRFQGLVKTLRDEGLDGWPLKWRSHAEHGESGSVVWEATKVERRSVPASLFSLSGYAKGEGVGSMMQLPPEQQKKYDEAMERQQEAMKRLTPEQRKQMEEMMKSLKGGGGAR